MKLEQTPKINSCQNSGFAIFSVLMITAIIGLISLAMVNNYLSNTRAASQDLHRLKAKHTLDAGLNFAALSLASPRTRVSRAAIPSARLVYRTQENEVYISIQNEAGFVSLPALIEDEKGLKNKELLEAVFKAIGVSVNSMDQLLQDLSSAEFSSNGVSLRQVTEILSRNSINIDELLALSSLYAGQQGINPELAPPAVLALVPELARATQQQILEQRGKPRPQSLISQPLANEHFNNRVSAFYRIKLETLIGDQRFERTQVIKMVNQRGRLFEVVAQF